MPVLTRHARATCQTVHLMDVMSMEPGIASMIFARLSFSTLHNSMAATCRSWSASLVDVRKQWTCVTPWDDPALRHVAPTIAREVISACRKDVDMPDEHRAELFDIMSAAMQSTIYAKDAPSDAYIPNQYRQMSCFVIGFMCDHTIDASQMPLAMRACIRARFHASAANAVISEALLPMLHAISNRNAALVDVKFPEALERSMEHFSFAYNARIANGVIDHLDKSLDFQPFAILPQTMRTRIVATYIRAIAHIEHKMTPAQKVRLLDVVARMPPRRCLFRDPVHAAVSRIVKS